ncbi:unnamed protein product [Caretta caretta]
MEGLVVNLINIYALISGPERLRFYQQASAFLSTLDPRKCLILGRDFNTTLEEWDHLGTEQCPATADVLREIVDHHSLVDIWRDQHPDNISKFTFVRVEAHQSHHSQLDHIYLSPRQWWDLGKVCAQLFCHDYTQGTSRWRDAAIEQLEREILELERRLAASTEDPPLCEACREKREELQALKDHRARGTFVQSHIHLLWKMDHGSCFFYTLEKRRGAKKHVTCLLAEDGTPLTDPAEMQAVLALLPKTGDLHDLQNWRPISLPSMDCKVVVKAISLWLGSVLADVVHPDQTYTYTIPGCTIFDNLYLVRDLLELGWRDGLSFALPVPGSGECI